MLAVARPLLETGESSSLATARTVFHSGGDGGHGAGLGRPRGWLCSVPRIRGSGSQLSCWPTITALTPLTPLVAISLTA